MPIIQSVFQVKQKQQYKLYEMGKCYGGNVFHIFILHVGTKAYIEGYALWEACSLIKR